MEIRGTTLPGCHTLHPRVHEDGRGLFVKPFQASVYRSLGLATDFVELFYSRSARGVIRGLHFQLPPHAQHKVVHCVAGSVLDVVVDLRVGSPTYGACATFHLDDRDWVAVSIPPGCAHGFAALSDGAVMAYSVSAEHAPTHDSGIRWDSVPVAWPWPDPIVSDRDRGLVPLSGFESSFTWDGSP